MPKILTLRERIGIIDIVVRQKRGKKIAQTYYKCSKEDVDETILKKNEFLSLWSRASAAEDEQRRRQILSQAMPPPVVQMPPPRPPQSQSPPATPGSQPTITGVVNELVMKWLIQMCDNNSLVTGLMVLNQARRISHSIGCNNFRASSSWFERFKNRYDLPWNNNTDTIDLSAMATRLTNDKSLRNLGKKTKKPVLPTATVSRVKTIKQENDNASYDSEPEPEYMIKDYNEALQYINTLQDFCMLNDDFDLHELLEGPENYVRKKMGRH